MMPRHEDLDFRHAPSWCEDCWEREQQGRLLTEMRRANDFKQAELYLRESGDWVEPKQKPRPQYALPTPKLKGGMSVEPRRRNG